MVRDTERIQRLRQALRKARLDALICTLPQNVLLLSGYWPVMGLSAAIVTQEGQVAVLAPEDEKELAAEAWADEMRTYAPASLKALLSPAEQLQQALAAVARRLGLRRGTRVGYESHDISVPAPYVAMHSFGASLPALLQGAISGALLQPATELLQRQHAALTPMELERVRQACRKAQQAFLKGATLLRPGLQEAAIAHEFRGFLSGPDEEVGLASRAEGSIWCMSGPNSALAGRAYARTRRRRTRAGDLVMVHCNSQVGGFWTDITRTFCLGKGNRRQRAMYKAVFAALQAAEHVVRAGVRAAAVDEAAREVLKAHGFGKEFHHGTGHGVGFGAISHMALPRLHPASPDVLESGMVFNIEPAIYIEGYGGLRHCDMVAATEKGAEVLTPFQSNLETLLIPLPSRPSKLTEPRLPPET